MGSLCCLPKQSSPDISLLTLRTDLETLRTNLKELTQRGKTQSKHFHKDGEHRN